MTTPCNTLDVQYLKVSELTNYESLKDNDLIYTIESGSGDTKYSRHSTLSQLKNYISDEIFTGNIVSNLEGNVIGNLTGNVTGNVTGNLTGDIYSPTGVLILDTGTGPESNSNFYGTSSFATTSTSALTSTSSSHALNSDTSISSIHALNSDTSISSSHSLNSDASISSIHSLNSDTSISSSHSLSSDISLFSNNIRGRFGSFTESCSNPNMSAATTMQWNWIDDQGNLFCTSHIHGNRLGSGWLQNEIYSHQAFPLPDSQKASKVYSASHNTFVLTETGRIYSMGDNYYGNGGSIQNSTENPHNQWQRAVRDGTTFRKVVISNNVIEYTFAAIDEVNNLYTWGHNGKGQLGNGTNIHTINETSLPPSIVSFYGDAIKRPHITLQNVNNVVIGGGDGNHTMCALLTNGTVKTTGYGGNGQIGNGTYSNASGWQDVLLPADAVAIYTGGYGTSHSFFVLLDNGDLYAWGKNDNGSFGIGNTTRYPDPVLIWDSSVKGTISKFYSTVGLYPANYILTTLGDLWATGYNGYNCFGDNSTINSNVTTWKQIGSNITKFFPMNGYTNGPTNFYLKNNKLYAVGANIRYESGTGIVGRIDSWTEVPLPADVLANFDKMEVSTNTYPSGVEYYWSNATIFTTDKRAYLAGRSFYGLTTTRLELTDLKFFTPIDAVNVVHV